MKNNSKRRSKVLVVALALATVVTSLAVFTDRAQSQETYTAGTLDLQLEQSWAAENAEVAENYTPGDVLELNYNLKNAGNLDGKVRETFVITTDKVVTNEFEVYALDDVEVGTDGFWAPKDGKAPITVRTSEAYGTGTKITYKVPERVIAAGADEDIELVLLFNKEALNEIQGTNVTVEYLAEMIQKDNTGDVGLDNVWNDAKVRTEKFTIGGVETNVVPKLN